MTSPKPEPASIPTPTSSPSSSATAASFPCRNSTNSTWPIASSTRYWIFRNNPSRFSSGTFSCGGFMDPAKCASVGARSEVRDNAQLEELVKDWLRYGEDLGLAPYYRDRPPLHAIEEAA